MIFEEKIGQQIIADLHLTAEIIAKTSPFCSHKEWMAHPGSFKASAGTLIKIWCMACGESKIVDAVVLHGP